MIIGPKPFSPVISCYSFLFNRLVLWSYRNEIMFSLIYGVSGGSLESHAKSRKAILNLKS
jgi:hypothetical protein